MHNLITPAGRRSANLAAVALGGIVALSLTDSYLDQQVSLTRGLVLALLALLSAVTVWLLTRNNRDIAQALLRAEQGRQRYHALFARSKVAMLLVDPSDGSIVEANEVACAYYGYPAEAFRQLKLGDLNHKSAVELDEAIDRAQQGHCDQFFCRHHLASGESRDVEVHAGPIELDGRPLLLTIVHDITERRRAEERLKLAASVFSEAREGIVITDADAKIVDVNRAFTDITGYKREEVIGKNPGILKSGHQGPDFYGELWRTLLATGYWQGEIWNCRKNGGILGEEMSISAVRDANGQTTHYVSLFTDITEKLLQQESVSHLAYHDPLTRLPNRILLTDRLHQAVMRAGQLPTVMAVCHLDLDSFKPINDRLGHAAGDQVLTQVAQRLEASMRAQDTIAHLGGDEFVLLLTDLESVDEVDVILARVTEAINLPFDIDDGQVPALSVSIGVTLYPADGRDADSLLRQANQAMYQAKQAGGNCIHLFGGGQDELARERRGLRTRIRQSLENGDFVLYWQPKVDMRSGTVIGAEALIRWPQPDGSLLGPETFLPHFEHDDLIVDISKWVLAAAMRQLSEWNAQGLGLHVSVNVAARHLQADGFADDLAALLQAYPNVRPGQFEIEVVETAALQDLQHVSRLIDRCRGMGVSFALDDFGTGYSSITYFRRLPLDTVKIDQSFVRGMLADHEDLTIVAGILGMTFAFGKVAVAEGVESVAHGILLLQLGCPLAQGYAISPPLPAPELAAWLRTYRPDPAWAEALAAAPRIGDLSLAGLKERMLNLPPQAIRPCIGPGAA